MAKITIFYLFLCVSVASTMPGSSIIKNPPANAGDTRDAGSIPGLGRSPGVGNGNLLQYSCLETPMGRGVWRATVHGVTELDMTEHTHSLETIGRTWL